MTATETNIPSYQENVKGLIEQLGTMLPADKLAVFNADAQQLAVSYPSPLKLQKGDQAPLFALPNAKGETISLADLLKHGPVVLTFYRGVWCPYCNLQLANYQQILPQIKKAGATLVAVSPMTPDKSLSMAETNQLQFEVLSDIGNQVASQYTTVFKYGHAPIQAMTDLGYDFHGFYGDESGEIPVPATFVIAQDGRVLFAGSVGGDYRKRVEPQAILVALGV
ncbi:peroxiredoxin-like family protein [Methylovulum miyakonense]|uniref:peroxiredoxin-like family protein n=1 Tax=Methylovulum miyakonense TaxID=645578 RepID=UPI00036ADBFC|nr:peroxiredoxin-like family protein [Methylovulum miyakonense]